MKQIILSLCLASVTIFGFSSCKHCKKCRTEIMGIKSEEKEVCGEELEKVEGQAGVTCR